MATTSKTSKEMSAACVKINFDSLFAKIETMPELQALANSICKSVSEAFEVRKVQIMGKDAKKGKKPAAKTESAPVEKKSEKKSEKPKAKKETEKPKAEKEVKIAKCDAETSRKLGLEFIPYSPKSYVLRGDTKPVKNILRDKFRGRPNRWLKGGAGYIFSNKNAEKAAKGLGIALPENNLVEE